MSRYKAADLARLGEAARRQIELAQVAFRAREQIAAEKRTNKFGAIATTVDGRRFASRAEAERYGELKLLARSGRITELVCQPEFPITVNGIEVCKYIADFAYYLPDGTQIIEDVKSPITAKHPVYRLKKKLVEAVYSITITEWGVP